MASFRTGPVGPGAGESGPIFEPYETGLPSSSRLRSNRKESGASHERSRTIPQPKAPSRLPQSLPLRRPSYDQAEQIYYDRKPQTRNSMVGGNSTTVSSGIPNPSSSISNNLPTPASRRRNVLRRKHSGLQQEMPNSREGSRDESRRTSSSASNPFSQTTADAYAGSHFDRKLTASPMEIRVAQQVDLPRTTAQTVTIYPELDRYRGLDTPARAESPGLELPHRIATHDLPPPTPLFSGASSQISGWSGSPSTRFSGSPGPGPYSRDTTPTSISSQSPGLVAPMRIPTSVARMRQIDPAHTRPPVSRRRTGSISNDTDAISAHTQGLAAVRESLTSSSSSNSTVREADKKDQKKKKRLSPPPPSPPPRKSSQKFRKNRDEDESPAKSSREPAQPLMIAPPKSTASSYSRPRPRPTQSQSAPSVPTVQTIQSAVSPKPAPPVRPSRDGTPDLHSQVGLPLPIIHSNLSTTSLSERRQSSQFPPGQAPASLAILSTSAPDRPSYLSRAPVGREPTPVPRSGSSADGMNATKPPSGRSTRTPSPSVSGFKSRFPLFGRKSKAAAEPAAPSKAEKPARKGPAAGTGHEGYGKLGAVRRRSNSVATPGRAIPGTMSSQETLGSNQSTDPFLLERMAPVVIAGGEVIENRNTSSELYRTESNQSFSYGRPSVESRNSSQVSLSSREGARHTLWPSPFPRPATKTPSIGSRRPSDSSDSEAPAFKSSLAVRRSMQRLKSGEQETPRIPKPIVTRAQVISPSITSADASIMSDDSVFVPSAEPAVRSKEADGAPAPKKLLKRARSPRKWNFFSRSHSQPAVEKIIDEKPSSAVAVAAAVKVVPPSKPVPFYAIMDSSEQEDSDAPDVEQILRAAKGKSPLLNPQTTEVQKRMSAITRAPAPNAPAIPEDPAPQQIAPRRHHHAPPVSFPKPLLSPPQPVSVPGPSKRTAPAQAPAPPKPTGRPSRLPQVGRIPKVVSARAEQISPKSFSRPFHRLSYQAPILTVDDQDSQFVAKGPSPPKPSTPELTQDGSTTTTGTNASTFMFNPETEATPGDLLEKPLDQEEFLSFPPRKDSQSTTTTTTSSSGGLFTYANATAVIPDRHTPLAEDEIWDEYNDLLGEDTMRVVPSARQSLAKGPRHQAVKPDGRMHALPSLESPTVNTFPMQSINQALEPPKEKEPVTSSIYSLDFGARIKQALELADDPVTSFYDSESPCSAECLDEDEQEVTVASPAQTAPPRKTEVPQPPKEINTASARRQLVRQSDASGSSLESQDNSPISQVNLRVGSMTVSKWLTFGHVLFSPVREELIPMVGSLKRHSILVIDGLGNDDWSFYAAETYPAATFFNLSPRAPPPADHQASSAFPTTPPNHHQVQYTSHLDKFPFSPQSFTSVVFRFPAAAPETHYRNVMSEARRVLKPGGFIELSILDVDLNNMGNRGRRAIRRLKERIHAKAPDTSLGSTSDLVLRLMGRKGFTEIKTCRVGVPVASVIAKTSSQQGGQVRRGSSASHSRGHSRSGSIAQQKRKDDRSLPEMINDEGPVADENITNMVAKVGRWWYTRCYENAASSSEGAPRGGIWRDKALLAECEEWGTSLKLMVCHARVPSVARVASI
ncbi:hypothetical protein V8F33_003143 [Rhypophila sp. PSN 637]